MDDVKPLNCYDGTVNTELSDSTHACGTGSLTKAGSGTEPGGRKTQVNRKNSSQPYFARSNYIFFFYC